jgi:hypothetical protein
MEDKLPESLELQEEAQLAAMVDHMDFGLQVRTDQLGEEETAATARQCRFVSCKVLQSPGTYLPLSLG